MAYVDKFLDPVNGNNGNSGDDMDNAWQTMAFAAIQNVTSMRLWVRSTLAEVISATINPTADGTIEYPCKIIAWPLAEETGTGDFTAGSTTVTNIDVSMVKTQHVARNITVDGVTYFIDGVTDGSTIELNKPYQGATDTGVSLTIAADYYYDEAQAIDDSGWTIKKSDWNSDPVRRAEVDFNGGNFNFYHSGDSYWEYSGLYLHDSLAYGMIYCAVAKYIKLTNIVTINNQNRNNLRFQASTYVYCENCYIEADSPGSTATYWINVYGGGAAGFYRCSFQGGYYGLRSDDTYLELYECTLGTIIPPSSACIYADYTSRYYLYDCIYDDNLDQHGYRIPPPLNDVCFINDQGVVDAHRWYIPSSGEIKSNDGSGADVNLRTGGASKVMDIIFNRIASEYGIAKGDEFTSITRSICILEHELEAPASAQTLRYYIQSVGALTTSQLWMEIQYMSSYSDDDEYVRTVIKSTNNISARADEDDWTQYLECALTPALENSRIKVRIFLSYYHATNKIYIDPLPEDDGGNQYFGNEVIWVKAHPQVVRRYFNEAARNTDVQDFVKDDKDYLYLNATVTGSYVDPSITGISPNTGSILGGTSVDITGVEFEDSGNTVSWDNSTVTINTENSVSINVTTPAHAIGSVDIVVNNVATLSSGFTYQTAAAPTTPTNFVALSNNTVSAIDLSWDFVETAENFDLYRASTIGATYSIRATDITDLEYQDTGLGVSETWFYRLKATNEFGESGFTSISQATTLPNRPDTPSLVTVTTTAYNQLTVAWSSVSGASQYELYRGNALITTTANLYYLDGALYDDTTYRYRVKAKKVV